MIIRILFFLMFMFLLKPQASAQRTVLKQNLYWLRYYNQLSISKKLTWHNEIDDRRFFENNRRQQLIFHSRLQCKFIKNFDAAFGFTYSSQSPQDPHSTSTLTIPEFRPVQEISYSNSLSSKFNLQQRLRIDERFIHRNDGVNLLEGYDFNIRFRYRIQMSYRINRIEDKVPIAVRISDELMINSGNKYADRRFDQNRIYTGVELGFAKNLSAELGYLHLFQQRSKINHFFERDIIRITIYHKIQI